MILLFLVLLGGVGALFLGTRASVATVVASPPPLEQVHTVPFAELGELPGGPLATTPGTGALLGRVLDRSGQPLASMDVWLETDAHGGFDDLRFLAPLPGQVFVVQTNADGEFAFVDVAPGEVRVFTRSTGGERGGASGRVAIVADQAGTGLEVTAAPLDLDCVVAGVVLDPSGSPVPRAKIRGEYDSLLHSGSVSRLADEAGRFQFLFPGRVSLTLEASDREGRWAPVVLEGQAGDVAFELRFVE